MPRDKHAAFFAAIICVISVTLWCLLLNIVVFSGRLPQGHRAFYNTPLRPRVLLFSGQARTKELLYRLVLMTALAMVGLRLYGRATTPWVALPITVAQLACIWPKLVAFPVYALHYSGRAAASGAGSTGRTDESPPRSPNVRSIWSSTRSFSSCFRSAGVRTG